MPVEIHPALAAEYRVILAKLPAAWFEPDPHLLMLEIAGMINGRRFLVAHIGQQFVGSVGWQDHIAFGGMYVKFLNVDEKFRRQAVATSLMRELFNIAQEAGYRAVFFDMPADSPLLAPVRAVPGVKNVGQLDGFHGPGVSSVIVGVDTSQTQNLIQHLDHMIAATAGGKTL